MKVDTTDLLTIKNYALKYNITPSYVYKLIKANDLKAVVIDGVQFIDTAKFSNAPTKR